MTDMIFLTDGDYHHGTKCPETKLEIKEIKMTETDISKVLIEGEYATIQGVKYKRVEEPKPTTLWNMVRNELGFSIDMCDEIVDAVEEWLPDEFDPNGSVYEYEIGWNEAIQAIKEKLR
jgi:hypothetical protein